MNRTLKKLVDTMKVGDVKKLNKLHALNMFKVLRNKPNKICTKLPHIKLQNIAERKERKSK